MMKKLLFLGLAFSASVGVTTAQNARVNPAALKSAVKMDQLSGDAYSANLGKASGTTGKTKKVMGPSALGTQIGKTWYDLMSNASSGNRIIRHTDGTISTVWTETCQGSGAPNFVTRGIGYNYYDGAAWVEGTDGTCNDQFGVASKRTGWPEIMLLANNKEAVITHSNDAINITSRPTKGTGGLAAWSPTTDLPFTSNINNVTGNSGTWPRAVSNGNNIHLIYSVNNTTTPSNAIIDGISVPMVYSRSTDGGTTWDKQNITLPGMFGVTAANPASYSTESFNSVGGDDYAIAVKGNTVAIVAGSMGEPWTLWKSTDNGTTFTRTLIHAVTPADTSHLTNAAGDTVALTNDPGHAIIIDDANNVHVWAGLIMSAIQVKPKPAAAGGGTYFRAKNSWFPSATSGFLYWNETMGAVNRFEDLLIADLEDVHPTGSANDFIAIGNSATRAPYGPLGLTSMANAAINTTDGRIYVVYSGVVEGTSTDFAETGQPFRDLYVMVREPNNTPLGNWRGPINISRSLDLYAAVGNAGTSSAENFEESVFPSVAHVVENGEKKLHIMWMTDDEPGMNLGNDADPEKEQAIMYYALNVDRLGTKKDMAAYVNTISAYPNPTNSKVTINVDLKKNSNVSVRVMNIMGQEVANVAASQMAAGKNEVSIDMSKFANGVYLYTVSSDNFTVTNRIVKQ